LQYFYFTRNRHKNVVIIIFFFINHMFEQLLEQAPEKIIVKHCESY